MVKTTFYGSLVLTGALSLVTTPGKVLAADPQKSSGASAGGSVSLSGDGQSRASGDAKARGRSREPLSKRKDLPWIKRWAPERNMGELGVFLGVLLPSKRVELFRPNLDLERQGHRSFKAAAFDVGGRVGYYPLRFLGIEAEGAVMPTSTRDGAGRATLWALRGHVVGQLGLWSVTPFVLVGGGVLSVSSDASVVGKDIDQALHFGGGVKVYLNRWTMVRFDIRDTLAPRQGLKNGASNNLEILLGLSVTLGREKDRDARQPAPAPSDRDGDGFLDADDKCPDTPGIAPDGCPAGDRDGDGFIDPDDKCPDTPGIAPDGCPDPDPDKDGILGDADQCPTEPETQNGYQDDDGCPDEVPKEVAQFTGTIEGIYFDVNKATIKSKSRPKLDKAVEVLKKFPSIRIEISGHTDSTGSRKHNMELSAARAEAVKKYLVEHGIDASRITTRGAGPDEPVDTNDTKAGRAKNRRIEFKILK